ncbi:MAG: ribonuclease Z [Candidatus Nanoarchaeia archaeon]
MNLTFLGTAGMVPTKERNVQSIYLDVNGKGILFDCGEGTQRQLQMANLNAQKITTIFISHWHGDHVSGLVGILQTIGNFCGEEKTIQLYGPKGSKDYFTHLMNSCIFESKILVEVIEITAKELTTVLDENSYYIQAQNLDHSVPTLGFRFVKKERRKLDKKKLIEYNLAQGPHLNDLQLGKTITYEKKTIYPDDVSVLCAQRSIAFIFDTQLCDACFDLAQDADVLISEAVYLQELEHKAQEYKHMTAYQAANVASQSGVKKLILTHFSQRYKDVSPLCDEAKELFVNTMCAFDLMKLELDF